MSEEADNSPPSGAESEPGVLRTGETLAARFRVEDAIPSRPGHESFFGREVGLGRDVVLLAMGAEQAKTLASAQQVQHAHLGRLLDVLPLADGRRVAVAARVPGETLEQHLKTSGRIERIDAVRSALRVSEALNALHEAGAVHGFVHARSVVVAPESGERPVLAFFPAGDAEPLHAPERSGDAAPTVADDTWAAAGLLHWMLVGEPPPARGYESQEQLAAAGVTDPVLRDALFKTLASDVATRQTDLRPLRRELARWFVEHASEEPLAPGPHSNRPPPLPGSRRPASMNPPLVSRPAPPRRRRLGVFAVGAIAVGLLAGVAAAFFRPAQIKWIEVAPVVPVASASASPIELGEVPVTGENDIRLGSKLAACAASYLPKGSFGKTPDVEWLCTETDPRVGGEKLRVALVSSAPKGETTEAMKIFARIGWYEMPVFAVVRAGCCPDAPPLKLPESECAMDGALRELGDAVVAMKDVEAPLQKYTDSIHCELNRGNGKKLRRATRPEGGEDTAFRDFVKQIE